MLFEDNTHAFIVRIWLEPREMEGTAPEWRGVIEHVPSGTRRYLRNLDEVTAFIVPYLEGMGVKLGNWWRTRDRLQRLWTCVSRTLLKWL